MAKDELGPGLVSLIQLELEMLAILYAPNWHNSQLRVVAITAGVTNRPVLLKALLAIPCNAASEWPARAFFKADKELTYPASRANAATLARPMTRHRMKGNWRKVGGSFSDIAGIRRCGTSDRQTCAVTTSTDAIPRRPYASRSALGDQTGSGATGAQLTSAQTTSLLPGAGGAMIPMPFHAHVPSTAGQGLSEGTCVPDGCVQEMR